MPILSFRRLTLAVAILSSLAASTASAFTLIQNDVAIGDVILSEGNAGTTTFAFPVTITRGNCAVTTVQYATFNATAIAGQDYTSTSGTLTFSNCVATETLFINVPVVGDAFAEPNEIF